MFDSNIIYKAKNDYAVLLVTGEAYVIKKDEEINASDLLNTSINILLIESKAFDIIKAEKKEDKKSK
jgi:hypothetical protein